MKSVVYLIFVKDKHFVSKFIIFHMVNQIFQAPFVKKTFSIELFLPLCQKIFNSLWIWVLYSFWLLFLSVLSPIPCCFDYCNFTLSLKIGQYDSSNFALLI